MRGPGSTTAIAGGLLVAAAWLAGAARLPAAYSPVLGVLPELLALLLLVLAWRFRRSRLAIAAAVIALSHLALQGPLAEVLSDHPTAGLAALGLLLPINLGLLVWLRDQPLPRTSSLVHLAAIAVQPLLIGGLIRVAAGAGGEPLPAATLGLLGSPQVARLAFLMAAVFAALVFAGRRSPFEVGLVWALVAAAAAVLGDGELEPRSLLLAAAQLALLASAVEDSYRLAYHDQLTGLPGRRALDESLEQLEGSYVIAMVDVDRFKAFNDRFGHDAGDQALRMLADELTRVGDGGRAFRYGGEEFAVLFTGRDSDRIGPALEQLRAAIEARVFTIRSAERPRKKPKEPPSASGTEQVTLTVSIGAAGPTVARSRPDDVLRAADAALYRAKRRGRNRIVIDGARTASHGSTVRRARKDRTQRSMFDDGGTD